MMELKAVTYIGKSSFMFDMGSKYASDDDCCEMSIPNKTKILFSAFARKAQSTFILDNDSIYKMY